MTEQRNDVLTPVDVERAIQTETKAIREAVEELGIVAEEAARAEVAFKVGFARARLAARVNGSRRVTNDEADDLATEQTEELLLDRKLTEHKLLVQREVIRSHIERLGGMRTIHAGIRNVT